MRPSVRLGLVGFVVVAAACSRGGQPARVATEGPLTIAPDIQTRRAQFVRKSLSADPRDLADGDRKAITHLVKAATLVDAIFQRQAWQGYPAFAPRVQALAGPGAQAAREYFAIMMGPWDRLRGFEPFLGDARHPPGAGFYPEDLTKDEFERWLGAHPDDRNAFASPVTVIRRRDGGLVAVPYSREYRDLLEPAAAELKAAALTATSASLRKFLLTRADAFLSDDYYESEVAWLEVDAPLEVVIGPYETYEDGLLGAKAAFEAFVCIGLPRESEQLTRYTKELPFLESRLPLPDERKNARRGAGAPARVADAPARVADEIVTAGDARRGVQTFAFNLPNDERVRAAKGSRQVLLKNMMRAKYDAVLAPVAARVLDPAEVRNLSFDSYFHHVLFHELAHGLGPGRIKAGGRDTDVRAELKELYGPIEEAKADVLGVYALAVLQNKQIVPAEILVTLPWTYLAGVFRAARFGSADAHGLAALIQANVLLEKGALEVTKAGRFKPVLPKFAGAIKDLTRDLLTIEAEGSYGGARALVKKYGAAPPAMAKALATLADVPVDIEPVFPAESAAP